MTQPARIYTLALAALLALLAALALLAQQAGQSRQAAVEAQLDGYLLRSLRTSAESTLATGLQLDQMEALQSVIEREHAAFARVIAIDIFSAGGTVLYSTDLDSRGTPVPPQWRNHLLQDAPWQSASLMQRQVGQRFDNDLGQAAGGIVVTLSTAPSEETLAQWQERGQQILQGLVLTTLALAATLGGLYGGLRRLLRPYADATRLLRGSTAVRAQARAHPLAQAAGRRREQQSQARQRCQQAMAQLEALDHER